MEARDDEVRDEIKDDDGVGVGELWLEVDESNELLADWVIETELEEAVVDGVWLEIADDELLLDGTELLSVEERELIWGLLVEELVCSDVLELEDRWLDKKLLENPKDELLGPELLNSEVLVLDSIELGVRLEEVPKDELLDTEMLVLEGVGVDDRLVDTPWDDTELPDKDELALDSVELETRPCEDDELLVANKLVLESVEPDVRLVDTPVEDKELVGGAELLKRLELDDWETEMELEGADRDALELELDTTEVELESCVVELREPELDESELELDDWNVELVTVEELSPDDEPIDVDELDVEDCVIVVIEVQVGQEVKHPVS